MLLVRLADEQSIDFPATRFADPHLEYCGDTDRGLIEAALAEINERINRAARSLVLYPSHKALQTSFAKLVNRRDELEQRLATLL